MQRAIEDISTEKVENEIRRLETLECRTVWARVLALAGGVSCASWLIYRALAANGLLAALGVFVALSFVYAFGGVPAMFAVTASILYFRSNAVGLWLPMTSYFAGTILLYVDFRRANLRRRVDPYNVGSFRN